VAEADMPAGEASGESVAAPKANPPPAEAAKAGTTPPKAAAMADSPTEAPVSTATATVPPAAPPAAAPAAATAPAAAPAQAAAQPQAAPAVAAATLVQTAAAAAKPEQATLAPTPVANPKPMPAAVMSIATPKPEPPKQSWADVAGPAAPKPEKDLRPKLSDGSAKAPVGPRACNALAPRIRSRSPAKRAARGPVKLFVGGLPPEAQDEDLRNHFKQYGELLEAQVICDRATGRSRNFGFIMLHEEGRKDAILRDNHNVCGKRVSVRLHQDMEPVGNNYGRTEESSQEPEMRKVFIGRLEPHFTSELLQSRFTERFGKVSDVFLASGKKFGFVTFDTIQTARDALDAGTLDIDGITIVIKAADPMRSGSSGKDGRERDGSPPPGGGSTSAYPYGYGYAAYGSYGYGAPPSRYSYPPPGYYDSYPPPMGYGYGSYGYPPSGAYGGYPGYPGYGYGYSYPPPSAPPSAPPSGGGGGYGPPPPSSGSGSRSRPY